VVASVSCIYGLGAPEDWQGLLVTIVKGEAADRDKFLSSLISLHMRGVDTELRRGTFAYAEEGSIFFRRTDRILIGSISAPRPLSASRFLEPIKLTAIREIGETCDLSRQAFRDAGGAARGRDRVDRRGNEEHVKELIAEGRDLEAKRLESRTQYDLEMLKEVGYCSGVENYSRHLSGRTAGSTPYTLMDYFPKDFLVIIDESHQSVPQVRGMFNGDASRKKVLVDHGFRLPSAMDNRPLRWPEFEAKLKQVSLCFRDARALRNGTREGSGGAGHSPKRD